MTTTLLLATEVTTGHRVVCPTLHAVAALSPGEGPHLNPKVSPNEDSLGVVVLPGGTVAACVADSHHGHGAGERLVRAFTSLVAQRAVERVEHLVDTLLEADAVACARARDRSESTLLVVVQRGQDVLWASLGDSLLFHVGTHGLQQVNAQQHLFGGGTLPLRTLASHPSYAGQTLVESGAFKLAAQGVVLLATDGVERETSGLSPGDVLPYLQDKRPLDAQVTALLLRATSRSAGGGRDNVALVALTGPG
jgi:serine/threonine protein phosphatase PrpC